MLVPVAVAVLAVLRTASVRRRLRRTGSTGLRPGQQRAFWAGLVALDLGGALWALDRWGIVAFLLVTVVAAPLLLWSLPEWWVRRSLARLRLYRVVAGLSRPLVAGLVATLLLVLTGSEAESLLVLATWAVGGIVVWLPLFSPLREHRLRAVVARFS